MASGGTKTEAKRPGSMASGSVLTGPKVVTHRSFEGFGWLVSAVLLSLSGGGAGDLQKTL